MTELKHPWALALLVVPLVLLFLLVRSARRRPALAFSALGMLERVRTPLRARLAALPALLRLAVLAVLVLAIARPRAGERFEDVVTHGVDIVIAFDVSGSMRAEDFRPNNRLAVARNVVNAFIDTRKHDRIGLVVFAGKAYTKCPLTLDYPLLKSLVDEIGFDSVEEDGTAIGMGIATAVNRLRKSSARSRVVILVTDGINNRGAIDPFTAVATAKAIGIKVYTVGVGTRGLSPMPFDGPFGREYRNIELPLDEDALTRIAESTGGYYFRATDSASFDVALKRISELETTRIETHEYVAYDEMFLPFVTVAAVLLALEALLATTWLRRLL